MKYRNKLQLYESKLVENELKELTKKHVYVKDVFCEIIPTHGGVRAQGGTELQEGYTIQRIFIRKKSIKEPKIDMYFKDAEGTKYKVLDFFLNYKTNAEWEFRTRIDYE